MQRIFVDTGGWFAYANRVDSSHPAVREALTGFQGRLVTSNYVVDETISLCLYRLGHDAAVRVGSVLLDSQSIDTIRVTPEDERTAWQLFCGRADQRYSFTDCTSFVLMRRLGINTAIALDEDFRAEGFELIP